MTDNRRIEWRLAATFLGGLIRGLEGLQDIANLVADEHSGSSTVVRAKSVKRNRSRHKRIVGSLMFNTCEARWTEYPDASCKMIRLRLTTRGCVPGLVAQRINCSRWYSLRTMGTLRVTDTNVSPSEGQLDHYSRNLSPAHVDRLA